MVSSKLFVVPRVCSQQAWRLLGCCRAAGALTMQVSSTSRWFNLLMEMVMSTQGHRTVLRLQVSGKDSSAGT